MNLDELGNVKQFRRRLYLHKTWDRGWIPKKSNAIAKPGRQTFLLTISSCSGSLVPEVGWNVTNTTKKGERDACGTSERICLYVFLAWGPLFMANYRNLVFRAWMWTGSTQKQQNWVSEGTAVESEQGWFELALYNLSNLFLMLTVQYSLYLTLVKRCGKKKIVHLLFESERGNNRQRAVVFFYRNGLHEVLFVTLQYIKNTFFAVFCRSKTSTFLNSSSFVLYLFYIIIQDTARYGLWTEVTFHLGCAKKCALPTWMRPLQTHTQTHTQFHAARAVVQHASYVSQ